MPIIRRRLEPSDVSPPGLRYNQVTGQVETLVNGAWVVSPGSDPRGINLYPPLSTASPRCDAATNAAAAFQGQINEILAAIDHADTLYALAGLILGLFEFGPFAIFISLALALAAYMLGAGVAAIEASLTPAAWSAFKCILYCHMDNSGRLSSGDMGNVQADITDQIGGVGAVILNQMLGISGTGGVNNLGALGTLTGDCSICACANTWCRSFDFTVSAGGWSVTDAIGGLFGTYDGQWVGTNAIDTASSPDIAHNGIYISVTFPTRVVTHVRVVFDLTKGFVDAAGGGCIGINSGAPVVGGLFGRSFAAQPSPVTNAQVDWNGSISSEEIRVFVFASRDATSPYSYGGTAHIKSITLWGDGENPFGSDNCI